MFLYGKGIYCWSHSASWIGYLRKHQIEIDMYDGPGVVDQETLKKRVKDADALISILSTNVDKEVIDSGENLKIIANYGAGFNNVDIDAAKAKGIYVTNTPDVSTRSTAELTFALVLAVARRIPEGDQLSRTKGFDGWHHYSSEDVKFQVKYLVLSD